MNAVDLAGAVERAEEAHMESVRTEDKAWAVAFAEGQMALARLRLACMPAEVLLREHTGSVILRDQRNRVVEPRAVRLLDARRDYVDLTIGKRVVASLAWSPTSRRWVDRRTDHYAATLEEVLVYVVGAPGSPFAAALVAAKLEAPAPFEGDPLPSERPWLPWTVGAVVVMLLALAVAAMRWG